MGLELGCLAQHWTGQAARSQSCCCCCAHLPPRPPPPTVKCAGDSPPSRSSVPARPSHRLLSSRTARYSKLPPSSQLLSARAAAAWAHTSAQARPLLTSSHRARSTSSLAVRAVPRGQARPAPCSTAACSSPTAATAAWRARRCAAGAQALLARLHVQASAGISSGIASSGGSRAAAQGHHTPTCTSSAELRRPGAAG